MMQNNGKNSRVPMLLLLLVFVLPIIISWVLYHYHAYFSFGTVHHGTLLKPVVASNDLWQGSTNPTKKWQIVYAPSVCCDSQCVETMYTLHQLQKALGKDQERVGLMLVSQQACRVNLGYPIENAIVRKAWHDIPHNNDGTIYLVDPVGNVFMYYSRHIDFMYILKDLKRVLEVSQIG